jgi:RimJ/RimL family protein N-acetyltransferase
MTGWLTDRRGARFRFERTEGEFACNWHVYADGWEVGHAYCIKEPPTLVLGDICLMEQFTPPKRRLHRILERLLGITSPPVNYRGNGLGSELLGEVTSWAKAQGYKHITGTIFPKDFGLNSRLPTWYESHGFEFTSSLQDEGTVGKVVKNL